MKGGQNSDTPVLNELTEAKKGVTLSRLAIGIEAGRSRLGGSIYDSPAPR